MLFYRLVLPFILFTSIIFSSTSSDLSPKDVKSKVNEMLKAHATYKSLDINIIERILRNYINEMDPSKIYFIESDIETWLYPSEETKEKFLDDFKKGDFSGFEKIHKTMLKAIGRRNAMEKEIENSLLPKDVSFDEVNDSLWSTSKEQLLSKLIKIRALHLQSAEKFKEESSDIFMQRIKKRRLNFENEIKAESDLSPEEQQKQQENYVLTHVLKAFADSLDSHTNYFTPSEAKQFVIQVQQRLFGIGALLRDNLNGLYISSMVEDGPADKSKLLKVGDVIIAVDNTPIIGMDITESVELIRGEKGTEVLLTVLRKNETKISEKLDIKIKRDEVILEDARFENSYQPYGDGIIVHLKLYSFYQDPKSSSSKDLKKVLEDLKKEHKIKGVILDLRNNSGGLLPQAVEVAGLFITKGIVASIKDNSGKVQHLRDTDGKTTWDGPLLVLTNKASASAAEIVTQTLQDYGRAIIVGDEKTFGKGSFQTFTLDTSVNSPKVNPKGEYKVTRGIYFTVSGKSPQLVGVKSDITVPGILSGLDIGEEFSTHPLKAEEIAPNFEDNLTDIPLSHRKKVNFLYKHNLQPVLTTYTDFLPQLKQNSQERLELNKNYQNFLKELKNKNFDSPIIETFRQSDLQLLESYNIMKDLIFFLNAEEKQAACY